MSEEATLFGPSPWMKKAVTLKYTRISDNQQSKEDKKTSDPFKKPALQEQAAFIDERLKAYGLPAAKKANWYAEVQSGTNRNREQWKLMMQKAMDLAAEGKRVFIAVQDPSRWSRNTRHSLTALDRLHDAGIPVFAAREGIQTGSAGDLHPTEELLFIQLQGGASFVSQEQKKKADKEINKAKEAGIMSSKGQPLWPFARMDPLEAYESQLPLLSVPKKEGGGVTAFRETVVGMTAPDGPNSAISVKRFGEQEEERRAKLTDEEYREWRDYRSMVRGMLQERGHDPFAQGTKVGKIDFPARALMRYAGRYLKEPWQYEPRPRDELLQIMDNFKDFLGTKDLKRYQAIVGKR